MPKPPRTSEPSACGRKFTASGQSSVSLFQHGDPNVLLFVPKDQDTQVKHERDELDVIQSGQGIFKRGNETVRFEPGDVLFVAAAMEHRFASFSGDFRAWVLFFGAQGGTARGRRR